MSESREAALDGDTRDEISSASTSSDSNDVAGAEASDYTREPRRARVRTPFRSESSLHLPTDETQIIEMHIADENEGASMRFVEVMSRFSDIVSDTREPFDEKYSRLMSLSISYLKAHSSIYGIFEGERLQYSRHNGTRAEVLAELRKSTPCIQKIRSAGTPVDGQLEAGDAVLGELDARFLGAAVNIDGRTRGAIMFVLPPAPNAGIASEQWLFIKMLARYIGNEASRNEVRKALTYRVAFEQLLADISRGFIHVSKDTIDQTIEVALQRIAEFADADTSYILRFREQQSRVEITHWWVADDRTLTFPLREILVEPFTWSLGRILNGEVVVLPEHDQLPLEAKAERGVMRSQGFLTAILAPLVYSGRVLGLVGFASTQKRIVVDKDKMQLLQMVGHTLASAVEVKESSERVQFLEEQIRHTQKLESLGVLAGGIAHDFNNLLMGILGNAGIALRDSTLEGESRVAVERVERIACHAGELTNQLLAYSGRGKFVVESVNLSDIAANMRELLSTVVSKRHSLQTNFAADLPVVEVDVAQISQVVMNLITNASEAIGKEAGEITLSTGLLSVSADSLYESFYSNDIPDGVYVYLRVRDTGIGMDEATRARIFDPFFSTKFTGRGLGLAAVLGIVRSHGGTIRVDSALGQGTTFSVLIPCAKRQELTTKAEVLIAPEAEQREKQSLSGKCILVVDDEEAIRTVLEGVLRGSGCAVMVAASGTEAISIYEQHRDAIDACVVDMTMPDISGYEVCERVRAITRNLPIILTSGYSEQEVRKHCQALQETVFLQKPFHPKMLLEQLRNVLS